MEKKKPNGYWKIWENVESAIKPFIINNQFPTIEFLGNNVRGLRDAISKVHGGMASVAKRMGCKLSTHFLASDGHFLSSSYEFIVDEFLFSRGIKHEVNGRIGLDCDFLYDFKLDGDFYVEVWGFNKNRNNKRNADYNERRRVKTEYYNSNNLKLISIESKFFDKAIDDIEKGLEIIFSQNGFDVTLKSQHTIHKTLNDLTSISKDNIKCKFYWSDETVEKEMKIIIDDFGYFPPYSELYKKYPYMPDVIRRFGGFHKMRQKMGTPSLIPIARPKGYWTDETIEKELQEIISIHGYMPVSSEMRKINRYLDSAIQKHKGYTYFRKKLNAQLIKKPTNHDYWTEDKITEEIKPFIEKYGNLLSNKIIKKENSLLSNAITRNNGLWYFKEKFNIFKPYKPNKYWTEKTIIKELTNAITIINKFPSYKDLKDRNMGGLADAVKRHGGFPHFRKLLNM